MLAIELSASSFCAREMRGTLSIASTVTWRAASCCSSSGFCAGQMKLTSVLPGRSRFTSSAFGPRTLKMMSDDDHSAVALSTTSAPAARKTSSATFAASPAPVSTRTAKPSLISFSTTSGTVATRFSPGAISFGTPIRAQSLLELQLSAAFGPPSMIFCLNSSETAPPNSGNARHTSTACCQAATVHKRRGEGNILLKPYVRTAAPLTRTAAPQVTCASCRASQPCSPGHTDWRRTLARQGHLAEGEHARPG